MLETLGSGMCGQKGTNQSKAEKVELALVTSSPLPGILPGGDSV